MQPLARAAPARIAGLFFFDFLYPGIGPRMAEPDRLNNIWYQSFNQLEIAPTLVGASRESCRAYIGYFLKHWSHRKDAFDQCDRVLRRQFHEARQPRRRLCLLSRSPWGADPDVEGRSTAPAADQPSDLRPLGGHDPLFPYEWADRLGETFAISISQCLATSATLRIARIPTARHPRSRRSSSASAGCDGVAETSSCGHPSRRPPLAGSSEPDRKRKLSDFSPL